MPDTQKVQELRKKLMYIDSILEHFDLLILRANEVVNYDFVNVT